MVDGEEFEPRAEREEGAERRREGGEVEREVDEVRGEGGVEGGEEVGGVRGAEGLEGERREGRLEERREERVARGAGRASGPGALDGVEAKVDEGEGEDAICFLEGVAEGVGKMDREAAKACQRYVVSWNVEAGRTRSGLPDSDGSSRTAQLIALSCPKVLMLSS